MFLSSFATILVLPRSFSIASLLIILRLLLFVARLILILSILSIPNPHLSLFFSLSLLLSYIPFSLYDHFLFTLFNLQFSLSSFLSPSSAVGSAPALCDYG